MLMCIHTHKHKKRGVLLDPVENGKWRKTCNKWWIMLIKQKNRDMQLERKREKKYTYR